VVSSARSSDLERPSRRFIKNGGRGGGKGIRSGLVAVSERETRLASRVSSRLNIAHRRSPFEAIDSRTRNSCGSIDTSARLTYVYGTSAAEAEDEQVKDEARLQVVHGSVDGPRARGHRTLITAPAKKKKKKMV